MPSTRGNYTAVSAPRALDQGGIHWYSVWLFSADKSQSAFLKADGLLTLASSSMVPSWWPLLLITELLGLVSSKSGGKISQSQSWEKLTFNMNFQLILLDHRQKISLTIQPQFHCELPVRLSATQIVPQLQLSMRFNCRLKHYTTFQIGRLQYWPGSHVWLLVDLLRAFWPQPGRQGLPAPGSPQDSGAESINAFTLNISNR